MALKKREAGLILAFKTHITLQLQHAVSFHITRLIDAYKLSGMEVTYCI